MIINHFRIDDRLIHGQIVTLWIADSKANTIIVADDKAANDRILQVSLKLAVPYGIKLFIVTLDEAAKLINDEKQNNKVLLIARNPKTAYELTTKLNEVKSINVGNISNLKSDVERTKLLQYIFVSPDDVDYLKKIADLNVELDVRSIPTDKSINGRDLLTRNGL